MTDANHFYESLAVEIAERVAKILEPKQGSKRLMSLETAADYIDRTPEALRAMIAAGKVPVVRADRRMQLDVRDLDAWIERNKITETV